MPNRIEMIQDLLSGKIDPKDFSESAKEVMSERVIVASVEKYHAENQYKGVKM
jgi:hypothetical protein